MIRRDFLRALAAFGTVAATGSGVAVAASASPTLVTPGGEVALDTKRHVGLYSPVGYAPLDLRVIRGDTFWFDVTGPFIRRAEVIAAAGGTKRFGLIETTFSTDGPTRTLIGMAASDTAIFRPGVHRWMAYGTGDHPVVGGSFIVEPDELWEAEQKVIDIATQLHPMGVVVNRYGVYEVGLRERLRQDEPSAYANRLQSLVTHARPTRCEILNGGTGALVSFKPRGLLG